MSFSESFSSIFSKKDKAKTPPAKAEAMPSAETEKKPTDQELIDDGLARVETMLANAEKHKKEPRGMEHLANVEFLLNIVETAKDGDKSALDKLRRAYLSPEERASRLITATTPEGKEVSVDTRAILADSISFFETNGMTEFADYLKTAEPTLSAEAAETIKEMIETHGIDRFIIFPPENIQHTAEIIQKLKANLADKELPGLSKADQYSDSYLSDKCQNPVFPDTPYGKEAKAKRQETYLFGYSSQPVPEDSKNLTYSEAEKYLEEKKLNGFTLSEYYIAQRIEAEQNKNHQFDAYDNDQEKSNLTWLIDSRAPGRCVHARWDPGDRQVRVDWIGADRRLPELGARPAIVVPLL